MKFEDWLNSLLLNSIPNNIIAFNFNLYESETDKQYDVQLVGSSYYSIDDEDWACNTEYSSGEILFSFMSDEWEIALQDFINLLKKYLQLADMSNRLKQAEYITAGFVDGDLEIVSKNGFLM